MPKEKRDGANYGPKENEPTMGKNNMGNLASFDFDFDFFFLIFFLIYLFFDLFFFERKHGQLGLF
jgi:hypothetical protein